MAHLSLSLLGPFLAELDGKQLSGFRSDKVRALLAYLCVECRRPWSRATLAYLLWPDLPEKSAHSDLRNALSNLRRVLGDQQTDPPFLDITHDTVQFNRASDYWLDVHALLDALPKTGQGRDLLPDQAEIGRLEQAAALCRGDFLEGFALPSVPFEDWMLATGEHIRRKLAETIRILARAHAQWGNLTAASEFTRRWLELEPLEEAAHRHMMQLLSLRGRRSAAMAHYEACRQTILQELGIELEPETIRLYELLRDSRADTPYAAPLSQFFQGPGLDRPVPHALSHSITANPPVAAAPSLFVARDKELAALADALAGTASGHGSVRLVTGEPGSGKTALLAEFARRAQAYDSGLLVAWGQCNAFTGEGDPYSPFLSIVQMLAGQYHVSIPAIGFSPEHARRLWQRLPATVDALLDHGPDLINHFVSGTELLALARMHSGVKPDRLKRIQLLLQQFTERPSLPRVQQTALFEQFSRVLCALAQQQPVLLIVDDMQWIDPGSVNLLFHLARRIAGSQILLVGAYRSEEASFRREGEHHPLLDVIDELQRAFGPIRVDLMQSEGEAFVTAFIDSEPNELSQEFRAMLYRHTSGNPLFTIELLRGMQMRGEMRRSPQGRWVEGPHLDWKELPARVEAVIARHIGQLSPACRELLSVASVEGEQFTAEVMAQVLQVDVEQVCGLLSQEAGQRHGLVTAQTMRQVGGQSLALYRFRHALFQIFLSQQLDVVEKARLHGVVAHALERVYQLSLDQFPEILHALARHFETAGLAEEAVRYYNRAGKNALRLSANQEALAHFYSALRLLRTTAATPERDRQELDLLLRLGPPLTATRGWAPPELAAAYARAQELCETIDDHAQLIPALWLLATFRLGRSEHAEVDKLVGRLLRLVEQTGDPSLLALASLQVSPFYQGKFVEARRLLERASAAPDVREQHELALRFGIAPAVLGLAYLAECLWLTGFPDQASRSSREARQLAEQIQLPMVTCYAMARSCWLAAMQGKIEDVRSYAATLGQVAQTFGMQNFVLAAQFFQHWAAVEGGTPDSERITSMTQAIEDYCSTGTLLNRTGFLVFFGQACSRAGQFARGLDAVDESLALAEQTEELWFQAEAWRVKGELLRRQSAGQRHPEEVLHAAGTCFERARQVARQQQARWLELRAVVSLCMLWQSQSQGKGLDLLAEIVDQLSEGLDTPEMRQASTLLQRVIAPLS